MLLEKERAAVADDDFPVGERVIARNVSLEDYMRLYAEDHCEWEDGTVIKMSPIHIKHDSLDGFLMILLRAYLDETSEGRLLRSPFLMIPPKRRSGREPDLQILLNSHFDRLKDTRLEGAADLVIEIVSPESIKRDYHIKYREYESAGVQEYWILDPHSQEASFYALVDGRYQEIAITDGVFNSSVLTKLRFAVQLLWDEPLLSTHQILSLVESMLHA